MDSFIDAVFVLSVKCFYNRIDHIKRELKKHKINYNFIFDYDPESITDALDVQTFASDCRLTVAQKSLVLKHIHAWHISQSRNYKRILIFEDDVILAENFIHELLVYEKDINTLQSGYLIFLGGGDAKMSSEFFLNKKLLFKHPLTTAEGYITDLDAIHKRLSWIEKNKIILPADHLINQIDKQMSIEQYWLKKPLVCQGSVFGLFDTTLDANRSKHSTVYNYLRYYFHKFRRRTLKSFMYKVKIKFFSYEVTHMINIVRILLIGILLAMLMSPPMTNLLELMVYLAFIFSCDLRMRFLNILKQPMMMATIAFFLIVSIGVFYSYGPLYQTCGLWVGWRKLLLIPFALAVFDTDKWKLRIIWAFLGFVLCGVLISYITFYFPNIQIYTYPAGISIRNHATQGMIFSTAMFASVVLSKSIKFSNLVKILLFFTALLNFANVIFITPGRSGYLSLIVFSVIAGIFFSKKIIHYLISIFLIPVIIISLLYISPIAHHRVQEALLSCIDKRQHVDSIENKNISDLSWRIIIWKNSIKMITERPFFGYGTGGFESGYTHIRHHDRQLLSHDPHNQFVKILAEYGVMGFFVFFVFIVAFFLQKVRQPFYVLGIGVLLVWCATSMFSSHFSTFTEGRFLFLWCASMLTPVLNTHIRSS